MYPEWCLLPKHYIIIRFDFEEVRVYVVLACWKKASFRIKIKFVKTEGTRVWTTSRRINADGSLIRAFVKRVKKEAPTLSEKKVNLNWANKK